MVRRKILVVDDDPLFAEGVTAVLEMRGYDARYCYSGRECIEKVLEFSPDLIVSDHVMGDMTGLEVLRALKERGIIDEIPFIAITGFKSRLLQKDFEAAGAHTIISKSEASQRLLDVVDELLRRGEQT